MFSDWVQANIICGYELEDAYSRAVEMEEIFKREGRFI